MTWQHIGGNWMLLLGAVKEKWGKLTHDDQKVVAGKREQLVGRLQKKYGYDRAQAEKEADKFSHLLKP